MEKVVIALTALFIIVSVWLMFGGNLFDPARKSDVMPEASGISEEIGRGTVVEQDFTCSVSSFSEIAIVFTKAYIAESGSLVVELRENDEVLASQSIPLSSIRDQHRTYLKLNRKLTDTLNKEYTIVIYPGGDYDTGVMIMTADKSGSSYRFGKQKINGSLCFAVA